MLKIFCTISDLSILEDYIDVDRSFYYQPEMTLGKPVWFDTVRGEYFACREGVAMVDMSSFTKFDLKVTCKFSISIALFGFQNNSKIQKCFRGMEV